MSFFSSSIGNSGENSNSEELPDSPTNVNAEITALENSPLAQVIELTKNAKSFKMKSCAGLSGDEIVAEFTCALSSCNGSDSLTFYVWIGSTALSFFDRNMFMNLAECAEQNGASQIVFLLDADHVQLKEYRHTFKVLDADRVPSAELQSMIKPELVAKKVQETTKFYQM